MQHHTTHHETKHAPIVEHKEAKPDTPKDTRAEPTIAPMEEPLGSLADDETRAKDALLRLARRAGASDIRFDRTNGDQWVVDLIRTKPPAKAGA